MSEIDPYKTPSTGQQHPSAHAGSSSLTSVFCVVIFVSCVMGLLAHAAGSGVPSGAPSWYGGYHVSFLLLQAVCAVGMWFKKRLALFTLAIIVLIDVAIEISVLGEWDPISIGVALVMIYFLLSNLRRWKRGPAGVEKR